MKYTRLGTPHCMKIDTEGAEEGVLMGAMDTLARARPTVFLATHSPELHASCTKTLLDLGYGLRGIGGGPWEDTDELVAMPPQ